MAPSNDILYLHTIFCKQLYGRRLIVVVAFFSVHPSCSLFLIGFRIECVSRFMMFNRDTWLHCWSIYLCAQISHAKKKWLFYWLVLVLLTSLNLYFTIQSPFGVCIICNIRCMNIQNNGQNEWTNERKQNERGNPSNKNTGFISNMRCCVDVHSHCSNFMFFIFFCISVVVSPFR